MHIAASLTLHEQLQFTLRAILAFLAGGIIGWEREHHGGPAGIRTYSAITLGACVFGLISLYAPSTVDHTRISAQVVSGIGFLGAGVIFRQGSSVGGLTSAATMWASASVGLALAYGMYLIGILSTALIFFLLTASQFSWWRILSNKKNF